MSRRPSQKLLHRTIEVWQPFCPTPLVEKDAEEILTNSLALAALLKEIDENVTKIDEPALCNQRNPDSSR